MKIECPRELCANGQTDGQTHKVTYWAPVGAKNLKNCQHLTVQINHLEHLDNIVKKLT